VENIFMNGYETYKDSSEEAIVERFMAWCQGYSLFVTTDGIVGLAPQEAREGDCVALLRGGFSVFLLRQSPPDGWKVISGDLSIGKVFYEPLSTLLTKANRVEPTQLILI
jgi:hypothetical protein